MSAVYNGIAVRLNDAENHRTDTSYEDSLIAKTFIFQVPPAPTYYNLPTDAYMVNPRQASLDTHRPWPALILLRQFVNSFASLFYIAFIKQYVEPSGEWNRALHHRVGLPLSILLAEEAGWGH